MRSAQVAGQWRGDTALTLPLFWRRSTVSPVFFGRYPRSSLSLFRPLPTLSPSLTGHLASVDVKQHESKKAMGDLRLLYLVSIQRRLETSNPCSLYTRNNRMKPLYELKTDQLSKRESYTIIQLFIYTIAIVQLALCFHIVMRVRCCLNAQWNDIVLSINCLKVICRTFL